MGGCDRELEVEVEVEDEDEDAKGQGEGIRDASRRRSMTSLEDFHLDKGT